MKQYILAGAVAATMLAGVVPSQAAGCIAGAIAGGIAAHVTHHSTLLGALGGCIVGKVLSHPSSSLTYADVTGRLLGSDADFGKVSGSPRVNIVKLSSLKGFVRNDKRTEANIQSSGSVRALDTEIAGNDALTGALKANGFAPTDVVAISAGGALGGATLFVNA
jgi:hypothetical protein